MSQVPLGYGPTSTRDIQWRLFTKSQGTVVLNMLSTFEVAASTFQVFAEYLPSTRCFYEKQTPWPQPRYFLIFRQIQP